MIRTLYYSIKLDTYYAVNSLIYTLRKMPVMKEIFTDKSYQSKPLKFLFGLFGFVLSLLKSFVSKFFYCFVLFAIANYISKDSTPVFYHLFFFFSLMGMFLNNKLLNSSMKKYLCLNIFEMDAKKYLRYNLFWMTLQNLVFNSLCFYLMGIDWKAGILLVLSQACMRVIGEGFDIWYFRTFQKYWYDNALLYFPLLGSLLICAFLPFKDIVISELFLRFSFVICIVLSVLSYVYIISYKYYQSLFKRVYNLASTLSNKNNGRDSITDIRDNDIVIADEKISNKTGYDYFHTIFYERHRGILLRSAKNNAVLLGVIYVVISYLCLKDLKFQSTVFYFLTNRLGWFIFIMYFINCGSVVTRAMFYNCDHAMLRYNFYRNPDVIKGLFKKRLFTVIKVNLLPAFVVGFGNLFLLFVSGDIDIIPSILMFAFMITLSIFYSSHHMILYYLLQPYDKDMNMRSPFFAIINGGLYFVCYSFSNLVTSSYVLSICGFVFCFLYVLIGVKLVEKYGPMKFHL
ncbi:MAG: hypothetical protein IJ193_04195 [Bacilli bacterium]|nr:hypothetical protein [Bacilli bacterium]